LRGFPLRLALFAATAAAVMAVAPAAAWPAARGATMFVHSAKSGELQGGRLILRSVGRRVTWVTNGGRSGVVSVARLHRRLFLPGTPPATGTLHVAGRRPGRELVLKLSRPHYNASRQMVSYQVKRLNKRPAPSRVASASQPRVPRRFGPASLSIVGAPPVLGSTSGGHDCSTWFENATRGYALQAIGSSNWDTDSWNPGIPPGALIHTLGTTSWESDGGLFRGCSASAVWQLIPDPNAPGPDQPPPVSATITFTTTYPWSDPPTNSCTSSNPQFFCHNVLNSAGQAAWWVDQY